MAKINRQGYTDKEWQEHRRDYTYALLGVVNGQVVTYRRYVDFENVRRAALAYPGSIIAWEHDMFHRGVDWCVEHDERMRGGK